MKGQKGRGMEISHESRVARKGRHALEKKA